VRLPRGRPRVWLYHGFGTRSPERDPHNLFVGEHMLDAHLRKMRERGWTALDLDGWLSGRGGPRSYLVTIDDGYPSVLDLAAPVFARHAVPAVLFVPPGRLGGTSSWMPLMPDEPLMSGDRLRELPAYGIEVGAHGYDHTLMQGLGADALRLHTVGAADALADLTGVRPRSFAYPEGVHDATAVRAVRDAGYRAAFAVKDGDGSRFAAQRTDVNGTDTERTVGLKSTAWWPVAERLASRTPALRAAAHRLVASAHR